MKKYKNISEVLPILMVKNNVVISKNDTITAYFEVAFSEVNTDDILDAVHKNVFNAFTRFPDNTWVDVYFTKTFIYPQICDTQGSKIPVINHLEKTTNKTLRERKVPEYRTLMGLTIPIEQKEKDDGFVAVIKQFQSKKSNQY